MHAQCQPLAELARKATGRETLSRHPVGLHDRLARVGVNLFSQGGLNPFSARRSAADDRIP